MNHLWSCPSDALDGYWKNFTNNVIQINVKYFEFYKMLYRCGKFGEKRLDWKL